LERLERYNLRQKLGAGTTGEVWVATDTVLERPVAIKFLHAVDDDTHRELFSAEARMLARLHHPGITTLFDAALEEKCYLVMEYVPGRALDEILAAGAMPLKEALAMGIRILEALRYAHTQGVIHRDLKPDNVMVTPEGEIKLTDFGFANLAALLRRGSDLQLGTPAYMPPEQIRGTPADERSDLYSFGVMLFELLTGRLPFEADDPELLLTAHLKQAPPSIRAYLPDAPLIIEHALGRLLAKDSRQRYPSAEALLNVLRPALARLQYSASHLKLLTVNDTTPMVGRETARLALQQAWRKAVAAASPQLVIISGEAGIGKTRLAADFLGQSAYPVFVGRGDADLLYAPFSEIFTDLLRRYPGAAAACTPAQRYALRSHLPGISDLLPVEDLPLAVSPAQQQIEFFETVRVILEQLGPLTIFLDDATRLDESSLALLRFLVRRYPAALLLIAACRSDEAALAWWSEVDYTGLELPPLSEDDSLVYLAGLAGGDVSPEAGQAVYRRSHGNPMFIEETMRHMVETKELVRDAGGRWSYQRRAKSGSLPPAMVNIFQRRLSRLSKIAQSPLAVAALVGDEFEFGVWAEALDGDTKLALNSLDEALTQRLVIDQGDDRYAFNPANLTGPLVESLSTPRRRLLHQKIASILRRVEGVEPARLATHYQAAGLTDEAAECWRQAGQRAAAANSLTAAVTAFEQANALRPALESCELLGGLYRQLGRALKATEALNQGLELAESPAERARLLNHLAFVYWLYDQYRPAFEAAKQALTLPGAPPEAQAVSRSHLGMVAWLIGKLADAEQQCTLAVQLLRQQGNEPELAAAWNRLGLVYFSLGQWDKAEKLFTVSLEARTRLNDWWGQAFARNNLAKVALERGDFGTAERELDAAGQIFNRIDSQDGLMVVYTNQGRRLLYQGQNQAALQSLNHALRLALDIGKWSSYGLGDIYLLTGEARLNLGDLTGANTALTEALRLVTAAGNQEYIAAGYALQARLAAMQKQPVEALAALNAARTLAGQVGGSRLPARVDQWAGEAAYAAA